jgi:hypothetical protein
MVMQFLKEYLLKSVPVEINNGPFQFVELSLLNLRMVLDKVLGI